MTIFAFLNTVNLAKLIEGILATAGGFLIGYLLAAIFGWFFDKYLLKRKSPALLHRILRLLGGLILAIIVAMMVFGGGGGSGNGTGDGAGDGKASPTAGTLDPNAKADPKAPPVKPSKSAEERVGITVLGGTDVQENRFYQIDDDPAPRTFAEVKDHVRKKKELETKPLGLEIRFAERNALPRDHSAVRQLEAWARDVAGLSVTFPAEAP